MSTIEISFPDYVRGVRASADGASVLISRLEKAAPHDITSDEKKKLKIARQRADDVAEVQSERDRLAPGRLRPVLLAFVSDWGACYDVIEARGRMPAALGDIGERARALSASLFPDGVSFTQLDAEGAWAQGNRRIERIEGEKLQHEMEELVGKDFLAAIRRSTAALADAIGVGESPRLTASTTALSEALLRFGRAVGAYGRALAANCEEDDPTSVERFLKAVAPIDVHRAGMRSSDSSDDTTDEETPVVVARPAPITSNGNVPAPVVAPPTPSSTSNGIPAPVTTTTTSNGTDAAA